MTNPKIPTHHAADQEKLRQIFDRGLTNGIGSPNGQTCIEGAIALACGEGLNDSPACVHDIDRAWAIAINDARWSSEAARSNALWPIAIAQIGTVDRDRAVWSRAIALGTIREVLPIALAAVGLTEHANACRAATDLDSAADAARAAADSANYAAYASARASASVVARAAAHAAARASARAADSANYAAADAARAAADAAHATANAARAAADAAHATADAAADDDVLLAAVKVAIDAYAAAEAGL